MSILGLIALALYLCIFLAKFALAHRYIAAHGEDETLDAPVTIVQPILSGDPFLESALRANLANAPASAQFLWLVDEDDIEAQRITAQFDARVILCPPPRARENPKTAKLQQALAHVGSEYVAILDDDTILDPSHLPRALHALQHATLYTGLPLYERGDTIWSSLVAHFVNNNSILTYLPLPSITINGMFYVMRTNELRAMGGFTSIADKLCDDYALATLVRQHNGTIRQGITPLRLHTTVPSATRYATLMQRWFLFANVLLRDQPGRIKARLIPTLGLPPILFALSFLSIAASWPGVIALIAMLIVRDQCIRNVHKTLTANRQPPTVNPFLSIASELLQPLHWLHATLQPKLHWRKRRILLGRDGTFTYVEAR
ncbi:MAG: glycosyltransferase [Thermoanaerobaculia bacterium]